MAGVMLQPEAEAATPRCKLPDIFREYGEHYRRNHALPLSHLRVMRSIERCRTAALGGHLQQCDTCGCQHPAYNSCRNRSASGGPVNGQSSLARKTNLTAPPPGLLPRESLALHLRIQSGPHGRRFFLSRCRQSLLPPPPQTAHWSAGNADCPNAAPDTGRDGSLFISSKGFRGITLAHDSYFR